MTVKLRNKHNDVLRVDIKVWVPAKKAYFKDTAIFDTGAYKTILDDRLAGLLHLTLGDRKTDTVTAAGAVSTHSGELPRVYLGTKLIHNIPVNIMRLPDELKTRCILGMNVLREFDISVSSYSGVVTLTPKPLPAKFYVDGYSISLASVEDGESQTDEE